MKDYYQILGLNFKASEREIRRNYHKLAQKYHPDHNGDEEKFKEVNEAYTVLSDPDKRIKYDKGYLTDTDVFILLFLDIVSLLLKRKYSKISLDELFRKKYFRSSS